MDQNTPAPPEGYPQPAPDNNGLQQTQNSAPIQPQGSPVAAPAPTPTSAPAPVQGAPQPAPQGSPVSTPQGSPVPAPQGSPLPPQAGQTPAPQGSPYPAAQSTPDSSQQTNPYSPTQAVPASVSQASPYPTPQANSYSSQPASPYPPAQGSPYQAPQPQPMNSQPQPYGATAAYPVQQAPAAKKMSTGKLVGLIIGICLAALLVLGVGAYLVGSMMGEGVSTPLGNQNADLAGTTWEANDGSIIEFYSDDSFFWDYDPSDTSDYYYTGTYEYYIGQSAIDYVVDDLSSYGVTRSEIDGMFDRVDEYTRDNFVCLVLYNEEQIIDGENQLAQTKTTPCYGFYFPEESYLDIANMDSGTYWGFTRQ